MMITISVAMPSCTIIVSVWQNVLMSLFLSDTFTTHYSYDFKITELHSVHTLHALYLYPFTWGLPWPGLWFWPYIYGRVSEWLCVHLRSTFTRAMILALHMGQSLSCSEHTLQQTRWPHGKKVLFTSDVRQTLHVIDAFMSSISCTNLSSSEMRTNAFNNFIGWFWCNYNMIK